MLHKTTSGIYRVAMLSLLTIASTHTLADGLSSTNQTNALASWNGLYVGAQLGGAWSNEDWRFTNLNFFNTLHTKPLGNDFYFNASSVIGGGNIGYNYQTGPWVAGLEGSLSGTNLREERLSPFWPTDYYTANINALGALKGRLGYAYKQWFVYDTGGWAFANVSLLQTDPLLIASSKNWDSGWTAGVGIEHKLTQQLSVGVSYDYSQIDLTNNSVTCPLCGTGVGHGTPIVDSNIGIQAVMARLSYFMSLF